jgi:hypothetical protein
MSARFLLCLVFILLTAWAIGAQAGEYDFDIPEAETSPYEIGGKVELRYVNHRLKEDSARYRLNYYKDDPGSSINELIALLEFKGNVKEGKVQINFLTHHAYKYTDEESAFDNSLYETYASFKPSTQLTLEAGKKSFQWGKGYAWNPVGFINRPKDPDDPDLSLEGFTGAWAEYIKSFSEGSLNNLAFTGLVLPVISDWANTELGDSGDVNVAAKLYLLWHNTDIDFMFFDGPDQPDSYGVDFAKNLAENFEIHGELAYKRDVTRVVLDSNGQSTTSHENQLSYMLGVRYLNAYDTTFIVEYYHNGGGYDQDEIDDFFAYQETAWRQWLETGNSAGMDRAKRVTSPYYKQRNFGKDYFYFKATQKEPLDILDFSTWLTVIVNLHDYSFNLQPGMTFNPITNLQLNLRVAVPIGASGTEFGEKQDTVRPETWIRYYF